MISFKPSLSGGMSGKVVIGIIRCDQGTGQVQAFVMICHVIRDLSYCPAILMVDQLRDARSLERLSSNRAFVKTKLPKPTE